MSQKLSESPLKIEVDAMNDIVTIEGARYSCQLFRDLGMMGLPVGKLIRIEARHEDGVLVIRQYAPGEQVTA